MSVGAIVLGILIAVVALVFSKKQGKETSQEQEDLSWLEEEEKVDSSYCNGDCAHCPPHYGYRYGRWYYGHGHQHGCQRGGNGGASGSTYRN